MAFQASQYSGCGSCCPSCAKGLPCESQYSGYDGRLADWWDERKEVRAERKTERAEELLEKAEEGGALAESRRRRAGRKGGRAADLRDVKQIDPSIANAAKLWKVKYPWGERKKMGAVTAARALTPLALGRRPKGRLIDSEQRATIHGGVNALYVAGITPYTGFTEIVTLPFKAEGKQAKAIDSTLIGWANSAAQSARKPAPKNLKDAAEFIRQAVIDQNLEEAAWGARGLALLEQSTRRANISSAATGATAAGLGYAASALGAASLSPPWIQALVTAPAAAITAGLAAIGTGRAAQTKVQGAVAEGKYGEFHALFDGAFSRRSAEDQQRISQQQDAQLASRDRVQTKLLSELEAGKKEGIEKGVKLLTYSFGIGFAMVGSAWLYRRMT